MIWYLHVVDHLMYLFSNPEDAKLMRWQGFDEHKKDDVKLQHPINAHELQNCDDMYL